VQSVLHIRRRQTLIFHNDPVDSPHNEGETIIFSLCCIQILRTVVTKVTVSLSVLLLLGEVSADVSDWPLGVATGIVAAVAAGAANVFPGVTSLDAILRSVDTWDPIAAS
jgi:hypothetical protein